MTPFSISPNPNTLYQTDSIKSALFKARLTIDNRQGLSVVFGGFGLGKSTVLRYLFADYDARTDTSAILLPTPIYPSAFAFLKVICQALEIEAARSFAAQMNLLESFLIGQFGDGKNTILFIDEAQILDVKQLELIRAILNFETNEEKLVQVVLGGQEELQDKLTNKRSLSLNSRIATKSKLEPLTVPDISAVIAARCALSNVENPFSEAHAAKLFEITGGIPRSVIKLCGLLYAMKQQLEVDEIPVDWIGGFTGEVGL